MRSKALVRSMLPTAALIVGSAPPAAWAQAAGTAASDNAVPPPSSADPEVDQATSIGLQDIIVTGQRRESAVQDVAAVIEVLTADDLQSLGITNSNALQFHVPGVVVSQDISLENQIYIRGIGSNVQGIAAGNSVATYVDGVYIPNSIQAFQQFNDVARVEVLKGPQATLYGRNATGGAFLIVSQDPSDTFSGRFDASYGNYDAYSLQGTVNAPLGQGAAIRVSGVASDRDGYARNLFLNTRYDYQRTHGVRGALKLDLSDDFSLVLRGDYTKSRAADFFKAEPETNAFYFFNPGFYAPGTRDINLDIDNRQPSRTQGASVTLRYDSPLGMVNSVTSRREFKTGPIFYDYDMTAGPIRIGDIGSTQISRSTYHETTLTTDKSAPVSVILGVNYFRESAIHRRRIIQIGPDSQDRIGRTSAWSAFADGNWDVTPELRVVAGLRYSEERKRYRTEFLQPVFPTIANRDKWTSLSPRVGLEFRPAEDVLLYANATSGFKSGGFNPDNPANDFSPEKVWSYEAGLKSRFFDRRLRFNASAFYYDYKDIQVFQITSIGGVFVSQITNGGSAKLYGLDLSLDARVTQALTVGTDVNLLHSEYGSGTQCFLSSGIPCNAPNATIVNVKGNQLVRAPKVTATIYASYRFELGEAESLSLWAGANYRSRVYYTAFEYLPHSAPKVWMLDANVRYDNPAGWYLEAYSNNLNDKLVVTQIIPTTSPLGVFNRYAPPRTYGFRVGIKF